MTDRPTLGEMAAAASGNGLSCPKCGCRRIESSYRTEIEGGYRRVKVCGNCGQRMRTVELFERLLPPTNRQDNSIYRTDDGPEPGD